MTLKIKVTNCFPWLNKWVHMLRFTTHSSVQDMVKQLQPYYDLTCTFDLENQVEILFPMVDYVDVHIKINF